MSKNSVKYLPELSIEEIVVCFNVINKPTGQSHLSMKDINERESLYNIITSEVDRDSKTYTFTWSNPLKGVYLQISEYNLLLKLLEGGSFSDFQSGSVAKKLINKLKNIETTNLPGEA